MEWLLVSVVFCTVLRFIGFVVFRDYVAGLTLFVDGIYKGKLYSLLIFTYELNLNSAFFHTIHYNAKFNAALTPYDVVGNRISVPSIGLTGKVEQFYLRHTLIRCIDESIVYVPHGKLMRCCVVNHSVKDKVFISIQVNLVS